MKDTRKAYVEMNHDDSIVNILHISDLHFGIENKEGIELPLDFKQRREFILSDLNDKLKEYSRSNKIHIVVISGDIGFFAKEDEYSDFEQWITDLLECIDVKPECVIICPGNHDFDRDYKVERITKENYLRLLSIDKINERTQPFINFQSMCRRLGVPELTNSARIIHKNTIDYLYGIHYFEEWNILFTVLNSAWNEGQKNDNESRWLGVSLVRDVNLLINKIKRKNESLIVVTVFHHPLTHMNSADSYEKYDNKETSYQHIVNFTSLIMNGHTHGGVQEPTSVNNDVRVFRSGAIHSTDTELFEFEIISINTIKWSYSYSVGKYVESHWTITEYPTGIDEQEKFFSYGQKAVDILMNKLASGVSVSDYLEKLSPVVRNILSILNTEIEYQNDIQKNRKTRDTHQNKELEKTINFIRSDNSKNK